MSEALRPYYRCAVPQVPCPFEIPYAPFLFPLTCPKLGKRSPTALAHHLCILVVYFSSQISGSLNTKSVSVTYYVTQQKSNSDVLRPCVIIDV